MSVQYNHLQLLSESLFATAPVNVPTNVGTETLDYRHCDRPICDGFLHLITEHFYITKLSWNQHSSRRLPNLVHADVCARATLHSWQTPRSWLTLTKGLPWLKLLSKSTYTTYQLPVVQYGKCPAGRVHWSGTLVGYIVLYPLPGWCRIQ